MECVVRTLWLGGIRGENAEGDGGRQKIRVADTPFLCGHICEEKHVLMRYTADLSSHVGRVFRIPTRHFGREQNTNLPLVCD